MLEEHFRTFAVHEPFENAIELSTHLGKMPKSYGHDLRQKIVQAAKLEMRRYVVDIEYSYSQPNWSRYKNSYFCDISEEDYQLYLLQATEEHESIDNILYSQLPEEWDIFSEITIIVRVWSPNRTLSSTHSVDHDDCF